VNLARTLTRNLGAKALAVIVALLVWFNASGQEQVVRVRTAPLVVEGLADSLAISSAVPPTADVRVVASRRSLVTVGFRRLSVVADVSGFGPGRHRVPLGANHVRGLGGLDPASVQVLSPGALELVVEPMSSRRVQVSLATVGTLPSSVVMVHGGVSIEPGWVTVQGPASVLDHVQHVNTQPIDLARVRESLRREVALDCDRFTFSCEPSRVNLSIQVSPRGERVLANVPPTVLVDSDDLDFEIRPPVLSLTLEGPSAVLDTLSSGDVSVLLSMTGHQPATYRVAPDVIVPPGVRVLEVSQDTLEVRLYRIRP
jgi:YbbR domain-containing protein